MAGAEAGAVGGAPGVLAGALGGAAIGTGVSLVGLLNSGGSGGNSELTPQASGSISGFRPQGQQITQNQIAAQQHGHLTTGSTQAFTGSSATLNVHNPGHQPRDQVVRQRINPPAPFRIGLFAVGGPDRAIPAATVAPSVAPSSAPISASIVPIAPAASSGGIASGADVYNTLINPIVDREDREPRTPRRGDRTLLDVQRHRQEFDAMTDRERKLYSREIKQSPRSLRSTPSQLQSQRPNRRSQSQRPSQ